MQRTNVGDFVCVLCATCAVVLVGCKPEPLVDPLSEPKVEGTPLEQDDRIPIELKTRDSEAAPIG